MNGRLDIESLAPLLNELERAAQWFYTDLLHETPSERKLVVSVQSFGRKARCRGWYSNDQWSTKEGTLCDEMCVTAEHLNREPVDIVETIIHESLHFDNKSKNIQDVSKVGRHNKRFKTSAEAIGLEVMDPIDSYGFGYTNLSDELAERIRTEFIPDLTAFSLWREIKPKDENTSNVVAWACTCEKPHKIRTTRDDVSVHCNVCGTDYEIEEGVDTDIEV
tara:strand:- start:7007 stop:7666 length:660 start_codon:yes stop_codon:yes gene_type:complete